MIRVDFEQVVQEAAARRDLVIRTDDPVLLLAKVVNLMLEDLEKSMAKAVRDCHVENEELARRWRGDAESVAGRMLNAALEAGREAASTIISEGTDKAVAVIHAELASTMLRQKADLEDAVAEIRRWSFFMLLASGCVLAAAILSRVL